MSITELQVPSTVFSGANGNNYNINNNNSNDRRTHLLSTDLQLTLSANRANTSNTNSMTADEVGSPLINGATSPGCVMNSHKRSFDDIEDKIDTTEEVDEQMKGSDGATIVSPQQMLVEQVKKRQKLMENNAANITSMLVLGPQPFICLYSKDEIYQKAWTLMQKTFYQSADKSSNVTQCDFDAFLKIFHANSTMYADYAPKGRLSLLYIACVYGQHTILKFLLEMKASHNIFFKDHFTPVHVCARSGYDKCLQILLEHGADYTAETNIGNRAIHIAATYGHLNCVKLLVQYGENINNNFTRNGVTPLQCAITHDRVEVLQWLLENGADPTIGRYEIESIFIACAEGTLSDDHFRQILPIHVACRFNSVKCLKLLLDWGVDVNSRDEKHRTPLHTACLFNSDAAIDILLKRKDCDPSLRDKQGAQPLHILFSLDSHKNFLKVARACKLEEKHLIHIWNHTQIQYKPNIAAVIQQVIRSE